MSQGEYTVCVDVCQYCICFSRAMQEMIVQYHPYASVRPVTPTSEISSSVTNTESGEFLK